MNIKEKIAVFASGLLAVSVISTQAASFYLIHQVTKPNADEIICPNIQVTLNEEDITEHGVTSDDTANTNN